MIANPNHLTRPPADNLIWRYMDFPKFISFLSKSALWFSRLDKLTDQYEGIVPMENQMEIYSYLKKIDPTTRKSDNFLRMKNQISNIHKFRELTLANSWSIGESESFALWKIYLSNSQYGVAIRSTVKDFITALNHEEFTIYPISVHYYDYLSEKLEPLNQEMVSGSKSNFYQYENEFRALILNQYKVDSNKKRIPKYDSGVYVHVDILKLVNCIYTSPGAPKWFIELVYESIKIYNMSIPVNQSFIKDKL
jgi:hypothetical protein